MSDKLWLGQLRIITATRGTSFSWKDSVPSLQGKEKTDKEEEVPCIKNKYKASATYQAH